MSSATSSNASQAKVLRLGVIHAGKIIEERVVKKRQPVVVGENPRSTIVVPATAKVGQGHRLFDVEGNDYLLSFTDKMHGRVSIDNEAIDLGTLKGRGLAKKKGTTYVYPLKDKVRGKIVLGDVTILFQFVPPPPETPKPLMLKELRLSPFYTIDWSYASIIGVLFVAWAFFFTYLGTVPVPEEITFEQLDEKFVQMIMPSKKAEDPLPKLEDKKADAPKKEEKKEEEKKPEEKPEETNKEAQIARRKEIQQKVAGKGVLAILGVRGQGKGAIADVFGEGRAINTDIDGVFAGINGVTVADGRNTTSRGGGGSGESTTIGGLATSGGGEVGLAEKAEQRVAKVESAAPEVDNGALDPATIARVVKGRLSAIKECYERELKRNPQLSGKITIRFTIDEEGRVSQASAEENTLGEKAVAACIVSRFERFRFPKPDGGGVTATYPFIFTPSS